MKLKAILLLLCYNFSLITGFINVELIRSFFEKNKLKQNVIFRCGTAKEHVKLMKNLIKYNDMVISVHNMNAINLTEILWSGIARMGMVVDADCLETESFLLQCAKFNCFDTRHFWLLLHESHNYEYLFKRVKINIDSEVHLAYYNEDKSSNNSTLLFKEYIIEDTYNVALESKGRLAESVVGFYTRSLGYNVPKLVNRYSLRRNLTNIPITGGVIIPELFNGTVENYLKNLKNTSLLVFDRLHLCLTEIIIKHYQLKYKIQVARSWGYVNTNGTYDGLVGDLQTRKSDVGLVPIFVRYYRIPLVSYGRTTYTFRDAFLLRNPSYRHSYEIFVKPLTVSVWLSIVICSIISVGLQKYSYNAEKKYSTEDSDSTWSFSAICTFGAFCQQGSSTEPKLFCGRIVAIFTLFLGSLVFQFYSASLVSFLLNVPTKTIRSMEEILENNFHVLCEDTLYNKDHLAQAKDDVTRRIYKEILKVHHNRTGFMHLNEGLRLVKKGGYAFHCPLETAYPIIQKDYDPGIICDLQDISMFGRVTIHSNYAKNSEFREPFESCYQRLAEYGIINREFLYWYPPKPECINSGQYININTGMDDFYPALVVLFFGQILSLVILYIEILWHNGWDQDIFFLNKNKQKIEENHFTYVN